KKFGYSDTSKFEKDYKGAVFDLRKESDSLVVHTDKGKESAWVIRYKDDQGRVVTEILKGIDTHYRETLPFIVEFISYEKKKESNAETYLTSVNLEQLREEDSIDKIRKTMDGSQLIKMSYSRDITEVGLPKDWKNRVNKVFAEIGIDKEKVFKWVKITNLNPGGKDRNIEYQAFKENNSYPYISIDNRKNRVEVAIFRNGDVVGGIEYIDDSRGTNPVSISFDLSREEGNKRIFIYEFKSINAWVEKQSSYGVLSIKYEGELKGNYKEILTKEKLIELSQVENDEEKNKILQQIEDVFISKTEEAPNYDGEPQDYKPGLEVVNNKFKELGIDAEAKAASIKSFLQALNIGIGSKVTIINGKDKENNGKTKSKSLLRAFEFIERGIKLGYKRSDYGKDYDGKNYGIKKISDETKINGRLSRIKFPDGAEDIFLYNGEYGRHDIPDKTVRVISEYIHTISNNTHIDDNGQLYFVKKWFIPEAEKYSEDKDFSKKLAELFNSNKVYKSQVEIKNNKGDGIITLTGYPLVHINIDAKNEDYGKPLWIAFKEPFYDDFGFSQEGYTYKYNQNSKLDSKLYRTKSRFFGKPYIMDWQDSEWLEHPYNMDFINDGKLSLIVYDFKVKDSSQANPANRGIIKRASRTDDGRLVFQDQEARKGPKLIRTYFNKYELPSKAYLLEGELWEKLAQEVPYLDFITTFYRDDVLLTCMVVTEVPIQKGAIEDIKRLFKKHDKYLLPADYRLKGSLFINGNLVITNDNRDEKYHDNRFLPGYGPQTKEGFNRLRNNIIGKHIDVLINETVLKAIGKYDSKEADIGKDKLNVGTTSQATWLLMLGILGAIITILGVSWLVKKIMVLMSKTPKPSPKEWKRTGELYKHAFKNGFVKMENGEEVSLWNETLDRQIKEEIDEDINQGRLPPMHKDSRRYFWEKYTRAVKDIYKPYIEQALENLGFDKYRIIPAGRFKPEQLSLLIQKEIAWQDERNKLFWKVSSEEELKDKLLRDVDFSSAFIETILEVFQEVEGRWDFGNMVEFQRKDNYIWNRDVDVFEYVTSYILQMLVDRIINDYKPQYREERVDLEHNTSVEEQRPAKGIYIKVERPRGLSRNISGKPYSGWAEVPLYRAVEDLIFKFCIGGYSNNVVFAEYLRELSKEYKRQGREKDIIPKVVMTAACFSTMMQSQMGVHQSRSTRGPEDAREFLNSVYFSLLFQKCRRPNGTFKDPFDAIGLTYEKLNNLLGGSLNDKDNSGLFTVVRQDLNDPELNSFDILFSLKAKESVSVEFLWAILKNIGGVTAEQLVKDIFIKFILPFVDGLYTREVKGHRMRYPLTLFNLLAGIKILAEHFIKPYFIVPVLLSLVAVLWFKPASVLAFNYFLITSVSLLLLWMFKYLIPKNGFVSFLNKRLRGKPQGLFDFAFTQITRAGSDEYIQAAYDNCGDDNKAKQKIRRALNHFVIYARPLPKTRELMLVIGSIALAYWVSNIFGLVLLHRLIVSAIIILGLPVIVSHLLQALTRNNLRSDKWMISYPAYAFLLFFSFIGMFGLPYIEVAFMIYPLWQKALVLFAALSLVALTLALMPRVTMYLLGWPSVISKRWERRLQFVVIYNEHLKYWAQKAFGIKTGGVKLSPFVNIAIFSTLSYSTYFLFIAAKPVLAALLGIIAWGYLLGCLNWYAQIKIIKKRFGIHNFTWSKTSEDVAKKMATAQLRRFVEFIYEDGHLNKKQRDKLLEGKDNGAALMDTWERLKWIANRFYKFDLKEAVFSEEGILWEKLQKLTWHPATFNDPIVYFSFYDGMSNVELPLTLSTIDKLRGHGEAAISQTQINSLDDADKKLFLTYYEDKKVNDEPFWVRKEGVFIKDYDVEKLKTFFKNLGIRIKNKSYHSEFNNLVVNSAGTQWNNFLHNIFERGELRDTLNCVLSLGLRNRLDFSDSASLIGEIERKAKAEARRLLLAEKFENEEHVEKTMEDLKKLHIEIDGKAIPLLDMKRLKYKMTRMLNMYHATGFRNWEGSKLVSELGYRYLAEQTFFGESRDTERYFHLKDKYFLNPLGRRKLMRKLLAILKNGGVEGKRIKELEEVMFRTSESWIPLNMLTFYERDLIVSGRGLNDDEKLTEDERYFLLMDEDLRRLIRQKLDYSVIRTDVEGLDFDTQIGNTAKAIKYFGLPENKYAFDKVMTSAGPGQAGGQTGKIVEFLISIRGCIIPMMSRYRGPMSFRIDGISEIRPESAAFVPLVAARLSRPNVSTVNFPLYCADKRMGRVPGNEWIAGVGWTWCTQPWADEVGMLYEYGKLATKEEYEALIISPLERAAEDAVAGVNKVKNLGDTLYDDSYLGGEGRGLELIGAKGPNEKYAIDYFELMQDYYANRVFVDPLVPYNIKLTHAVLTFMFYGVKWLVYLNFLFFFLGVVVGGFDLTAGFVFAGFFLGFMLLTSQSINRTILILYNKLYGLHLGFFKWFHRTFVYPGAIWHFTYYIHRYKLVQKFWALVGKSDFIPTERKMADVTLSWLELYFAHQHTVVVGAGLWLLYLIAGPFVPSAFFIWEFFWIAIATAFLVYPALANPRMKYDTRVTRYLSPAIGFVLMLLAGWFTGQQLFFILTFIHSVSWAATNINSDRFQAAKNARTASDYILIMLFVAAVSYQHFALFALLLWMGADPNYRGFLKYVVGYTAKIFAKSIGRIFVLHWEKIVIVAPIVFVAYWFNLLGILPWAICGTIFVFTLRAIYAQRLFEKAYRLLDGYYRKGEVKGHDTLNQLAGRIGFTEYNSPWSLLYGQKAFCKAVKAHQRDNHLIQPLLSEGILLGRADNFYVRRYVGDIEGSLLKNVIENNRRAFNKFIRSLAREIGLDIKTIEELRSAQYGNSSDLLGNFTKGQLKKNIDRLVATPGIGNKRTTVVNYTPKSYEAQEVRLAEVMRLHIIAWVNQYFVDWITLPAVVIGKNKREFDSLIDCITEDLENIVTGDVEPFEFLASVAQKKELYHLINTIVEEPESVISGEIAPEQFLEKFSFVSAEKKRRFIELKRKLEDLIEKLTDDLGIVVSEVSPEQLLEKIGFAGKEKIRILIECKKELENLVGEIIEDPQTSLSEDTTLEELLENLGLTQSSLGTPQAAVPGAPSAAPQATAREFKHPITQKIIENVKNDIETLRNA
ncbi:MAG: MFS transporter, partial [Candidatus Omnitrophica bacterium]|nr:MFS transporter [Candidatus Omnitrophota bacterium]